MLNYMVSRSPMKHDRNSMTSCWPPELIHSNSSKPTSLKLRSIPLHHLLIQHGLLSLQKWRSPISTDSSISCTSALIRFNLAWNCYGFNARLIKHDSGQRSKLFFAKHKWFNKRKRFWIKCSARPEASPERSFA